MKQKIKNAACKAMVGISLAVACTVDSYEEPLSLLLFVAVFLAWVALTAFACSKWYVLPEKYNDF